MSANNTPPEGVPGGIQDAYSAAESLRRGLVNIYTVFLDHFANPEIFGILVIVDVLEVSIRLRRLCISPT